MYCAKKCYHEKEISKYLQNTNCPPHWVILLAVYSVMDFEIIIPRLHHLIEIGKS